VVSISLCRPWTQSRWLFQVTFRTTHLLEHLVYTDRPEVIEVADNSLLAFTAIGTTQPDLPKGPQNWPKDGIFVLVSPEGLAHAGDLEIAKYTATLHKSFTEGPFGGEAGIWVDPLQDVTVLDDGTLVSLDNLS
jgi:hypothetical protein